MKIAFLVGAAALAILVLTQLGSRRSIEPVAVSAPVSAGKAATPVRPRLPPREDRPVPAIAEPVPTQLSPAVKAEIAEKVRGADRPGMAAFRAVSDLYIDANIELARSQALAEGLTLDQVRELTSFGQLVLATQRTTDLEQILGRDLTAEQAEELGALMMSANADFKVSMRKLVAAGASEAQRWTLIRETQAAYLEGFHAATGMTEDQLDDLLAGNVGLPGAPASTKPPDGPVPPAEPLDDLREQPRPR